MSEYEAHTRSLGRWTILHLYLDPLDIDEGFPKLRQLCKLMNDFRRSDLCGAIPVKSTMMRLVFKYYGMTTNTLCGLSKQSKSTLASSSIQNQEPKMRNVYN